MDCGAARFGDIVRERRIRARLTQRELAERAGMSVRAVRYIEKGLVGRPRQESARRLAAALKLGTSQCPQGTRSSNRLWVGVLGRFEARCGARALDIGPLKQRCLLALLALQPNMVVSREEIVDVLWDDRPPRSCLRLVHTYVARLRKLIEPKPAPIVSARHSGYLLKLEDDQNDLLRFDEFVTNARDLRSRDPYAAVELFAQAMACWRGPLLSDLPASVRHHPAATAAATRRRDAAMEWADLARSLGSRQERVVEHLRLLAYEEPLHEALQARLMLALADSGQRGAAVRQFSRLKSQLDTELGVEPGSEVIAALTQILPQRRRLN